MSFARTIATNRQTERSSVRLCAPEYTRIRSFDDQEVSSPSSDFSLFPWFGAGWRGLMEYPLASKQQNLDIAAEQGACMVLSDLKWLRRRKDIRPVRRE